MNKIKQIIDKIRTIYQDLDVDATILINNTIDIKDLLILWKAEEELSELLNERTKKLKNKIYEFSMAQKLKSDNSEGNKK